MSLHKKDRDPGCDEQGRGLHNEPWSNVCAKPPCVTASTHAVLQKFNDLAHQQASALETALVNGLLPRPATDASTRLLIRDGLRTRYRKITDPDRLLQTITNRIGADAGHDAELLSSSFGADFLEGAGLNPDQVHGLRAQATEVFLKRTDGSRQQQANRHGLTVFRASNIAGAIAGYRTAGTLRLGSVGRMTDFLMRDHEDARFLRLLKAWHQAVTASGVMHEVMAWRFFRSNRDPLQRKRHQARRRAAPREKARRYA